FYVRGRVDGRAAMCAHRYSYLASRGTLDPALTIDPLCGNRACQNAQPLEQVPMRANILRSRSVSALNFATSHGLRGHVISGDYMKVSRAGHRMCRTCNRAWRNASYRAKQGRDVVGQRERTHCPNGHPYSGENLVLERGSSGKM